MTRPNLEDLHILMEDTRDYIAVKKNSLLQSDPDTFLKAVGDQVETFFQKLEEWRNGIATDAEANLGHLIMRELEKMRVIWIAMMEDSEGLDRKIREFDDTMYNISRIIGRRLREEDLDADPDESSNTDNLSDFHFPQDLFSLKSADVSGCYSKETDESIKNQSFFDGILAISKEGDLGFINVYRTLSWTKHSLAFWSKPEGMKGLNIPVWSKGLPMFFIGQTSLGNIYGTFIPAIALGEQQRMQYPLHHFKEVYDQIFDTEIPSAFKLLPKTSALHVSNGITDLTTRKRLHIPPSEFSLFGQVLKEQIDRSRLTGCFPRDLSFHFLLQEFGQDYPVTENFVTHLQETLVLEKTEDALVHIATNLSKDNYSLFWTKAFIDKIFKASGAVYNACGFSEMENGSGIMPERFYDSNTISTGITYLKCYNTIFKRLHTQLLDYEKAGSYEQRLFNQPFIAELISFQRPGIEEAAKLDTHVKTYYKQLLNRIHFKLIEKRLSELEEYDGLHHARIEFVCSLKQVTLPEYLQQYTGDQAVAKISSMCKVLHITEPLISIKRSTISKFLREELLCLIPPITHGIEHVLQKEKAPTPDMVETIHVCECLISFIIYGSKNYMPGLAKLGVNGTIFRNLNRITLGNADMRKTGHVFLLDASKNHFGPVFTISNRILPIELTQTAFTQQLLNVHVHLKLDEFIVGMFVLAHFLKTITAIGSKSQASYRGHNPLSILSKAFVSSTSFAVVLPIRTVDQFVNELLDIREERVSTVIETAIETLGDLRELDENEVASVGRQMLSTGLKTILNSSIKGDSNLHVDYVPTIRPLLHVTKFHVLVCTISETLIADNPPTLHHLLSVKIVSTAIHLVAHLWPLTRTLESTDLYLLYKLAKTNVLDVTPALKLLGLALVCKYGISRNDMYRFLRTNHMSNRDVRESGLFIENLASNMYLPISDDSFTCVLTDVPSKDEKILRRSYANLCAVGLQPF